MSHFTLALLIFVLTYLVIAIQRIPGIYIDRPTGALLGAAAMVLFGILRLRDAYAAIDMDTVLFLLGMMILLAYMEISGFFAIVERLIARSAKGKFQLLALIVAAAGILSALFMNDTVCLLLAPIVLRLCARMKINPAPYLIAVPTAANIGSAMTIIGNPQNALIGIRSGVSFLRFSGALWPVSLLGLIADFFILAAFYRNDLRSGALSAAPDDAPLPLERPLLAVSVLCGAALLALLCLGYPPAGVAMGLAAVAILAGAFKPRDVLGRIDWSLLVFFASLFIVMRGIDKAGVVQLLFDHLPRPGGAGNLPALAGFCLTVIVLSNLVSNVPAVLLYVPLLKEIPNAGPLWIALGMSATLSGNLTILGSVANVIVFQSAEKEVRVSYWEYFKIGLPLTLVTIVIGITVIHFHH